MNDTTDLYNARVNHDFIVTHRRYEDDVHALGVTLRENLSGDDEPTYFTVHLYNSPDLGSYGSIFIAPDGQEDQLISTGLLIQAARKGIDVQTLIKEALSEVEG